MSVIQRKTSWYYRFKVMKKEYNGVCINCETKKEAEAYEAKIRKEVEVIRHHRTVASIVEDYKMELSGGEPIALRDAFAMALAKPSKHVRTERVLNQKKAKWDDFRKFMESTYPEIEHLAQVRKPHCEAYISYLINNGRFDKNISFFVPPKVETRGLRRRVTEPKIISYDTSHKITGRTIKDYATEIKWVFNSLAEEAGVVRNPMDGVTIPIAEATDREIFTEDELALIRDNLKFDDFCRPLFTVAAMTGLTEGDICTLKWSEIHPLEMAIRRRRRKTGVLLEVPLTETLMNFLSGYPKISEYVFPEHAETYLKRGSDVSRRIKMFLNRLGIENTKKVEGHRAVSTKDLHSMRHVFCFYAGQAGIPLTTVQSIVGHMTPEMTRHYSRHDSVASKQKAIEKLPEFLLFADDTKRKPMITSVEWDDTSAERRELIKLAKHLPIAKVQEILKLLK
jgi:integrase